MKHTTEHMSFDSHLEKQLKELKEPVVPYMFSEKVLREVFLANQTREKWRLQIGVVLLCLSGLVMALGAFFIFQIEINYPTTLLQNTTLISCIGFTLVVFISIQLLDLKLIKHKF